MIYIGIDPGKRGAWSVLDPKRMKVLDWQAADCPKHGFANRSYRGHHAYSHFQMTEGMKEAKALAKENGETIMAVIEQQRTHPKEGRVSAFTTGYGFGLWCGILSALEIPWRSVTGTVWTREILKGATTGGPKVHNEKKGRTQKKKSIHFVAQMFPEFASHEHGLTLNRRINAHDGLADSVCLALYGHVSYGEFEFGKFR